MPQLGETVTEGTITRWFKSVGEEVTRDEPLFEVSTDKVDSEVPAPASGVLTAILVEEGDTVDVGVKLAVIGDEVSHTPRVEPAPAAATPAEPLAPPPAHAVTAVGAARPTPTDLPDEPVGTAALTPPPAAASGLGRWDGRSDGGGQLAPAAPAPASAPATASAPTVATADVSPAAPPAPAAPLAPPAQGPTGGDHRPSNEPLAPAPPATGSAGRALSLVLSPVVRKILDEHGIDPRTVTGTGLGGRITRDDADAAVAAANGAGAAVAETSATSATSAPSAADDAPGPVVTPPSEPSSVPDLSGPIAPPVPGAPAGVAVAELRDEVVPFTNIRRRTAEHMVRSKATSAHTLMVKEIDYERVEQVRRAYGERFRDEEGFGLSYLPFAARAVVEALSQYPHLNASVAEDALVVHRDFNIGIAVDLDNEGLIVPVVHNAEELNLLGMARRIRELADRARTRRLTLDDISGGTFSITNAGPFGTFLTGAIINQPQVAILSTDGVSRKPVVVTQPDGIESIAIHSVGLAAMSFDHRAVDGAYVARFLSLFADILNGRDWAGEL